MARKSIRVQQQYEQSLNKTIAKNAAKAVEIVQALENSSQPPASMETTLQKKIMK